MEHPRPQPHASYTLIFLLLIAAISQIVGEVLRPIGSEDQETEITSSSENTTRTHLLKVSRFFTWTPKNASSFLPRLFRPNEEIEEQQLVVEEINDDLLINDLATSNNVYKQDNQQDLDNQQDPGLLAHNAINEDRIEFISDTKTEKALAKNTQQTLAQQSESKDIQASPQGVKLSLNLAPQRATDEVDQGIKSSRSKEDKSKSIKKSTPLKPTHKQSATTKKLSRDQQTKDSKAIHKTISHTKGESQASQTGTTIVEAKKDVSTSTKLAQKKLKSSSSSQPASSNKVLSKLKNSKVKKSSGHPSRKKRKRKRRRYTKSGILIYGIDDPHAALKTFYQKLSTIQSKGNKVRIAHYGDSLIAGDYVTRTVRRLLQKTFGDAGHGFFLSGKGSRWYSRRWIKLKSRGKWTKKRFSKAKKLGEEFGLGGVSFTSSAKGAWVKAKTTGIRLGSKVDFFELHYLAHPSGGSFKIEFAGQSKEISTIAESKQIKLIKIKAPKSGKWEAKVTLNGDGKVTLYGFTFERNQGGIVYDSLGLEGARAKLLLKLTTNEWAKQISKRNPDLYILHYGTNESVNARMSMDKYKQSLKQVIKRFKKALPKSACLLVSPMDRAQKDGETGKIKSMRIVSRIVQAQREVSAAEGCAFWSTYDAMGGRGSMARWYNASPKLASGDLTHPTSSGANRIGAMFFAALMDAYRKH